MKLGSENQKREVMVRKKMLKGRKENIMDDERKGKEGVDKLREVKD